MEGCGALVLEHHVWLSVEFSYRCEDTMVWYFITAMPSQKAIF